MSKKERVPKRKKNMEGMIGDGFKSVRRPMIQLLPNDIFEGKLLDVLEGKHNHIFIMESEGVEVGMYSGIVLDTLITENDIGKTFRIKNIGKIKSKGKRTYTNYEVSSKGESTVKRKPSSKGDTLAPSTSTKKKGKKAGGKKSKNPTKKKS